MSLKAISSCADTDLHHDSGSKAISGLVPGGLAQAKSEKDIKKIEIVLIMTRTFGRIAAFFNL
jgi:hypothetical protein